MCKADFRVKLFSGYLTPLFLVLVIVMVTLAIPFTTMAQPAQLVPASCAGGQCGYCDLVTMANSIVQFGIFLAALIAAVMFLYAGWLYLTAVENEGNVTTAKNVLTSVVIGSVIILAAWLVVDVLFFELTGKSIGAFVLGC